MNKNMTFESVKLVSETVLALYLWTTAVKMERVNEARMWENIWRYRYDKLSNSEFLEYLNCERYLP